MATAPKSNDYYGQIANIFATRKHRIEQLARSRLTLHPVHLAQIDSPYGDLHPHVASWYHKDTFQFAYFLHKVSTHDGLTRIHIVQIKHNGQCHGPFAFQEIPVDK